MFANKLTLAWWTWLYELEQYESSHTFWDAFIADCPWLYCSTWWFNKWNTLLKQSMYQEAIEAYDNALQEEQKDSYKKKIRHNKTLAEDLLEENQSDQQQEGEWEGEWESGQNQQQEGEWEQEWSEQWNQEWWEESEGEWEDQWSQSESWQQDGQWESWLSQSQKEQLQQYQQLLEQQQQTNQQFFDPIPSSMQEQPQSMLEQFFGWGKNLQKELPSWEGKDW